jgi:hypothetical protein
MSVLRIWSPARAETFFFLDGKERTRLVREEHRLIHARGGFRKLFLDKAGVRG